MATFMPGIGRISAGDAARVPPEIRRRGEALQGDVGATGVDHVEDGVGVTALDVDQFLEPDRAQGAPILNPVPRCRPGQPAQLLDRR